MKVKRTNWLNKPQQKRPQASQTTRRGRVLATDALTLAGKKRFRRIAFPNLFLGLFLAATGSAEEPSQSWPFDQGPNTATITTSQVLSGAEPITYVWHDADDHGWQFIGPSGAQEENARVVALREIVELDDSVLAVADMPPGWVASRSAGRGPWKREQVTD